MGKTHLALELANPKANYVHVTGQDYENLKSLLYDEDLASTRKTEAYTSVISRNFDVQVQLPSGPKSIPLQWLDTPGEIWRSAWQQTQLTEWQVFLDKLRESEGIILVLPPYRELIRSGARSQVWAKIARQ